jgi:hypothetical protein
MTMKIPRDQRPLARQARGQGWSLHLRRNGHILWRSPEGTLVFSASTPSDWRTIHRLRSELRRHGLALH